MLGLHACPTLPRVCVECLRCHTKKMVNDFLWVSGRQPAKCLEYHFILCSFFIICRLTLFGELSWQRMTYRVLLEHYFILYRIVCRPLDLTNECLRTLLLCLSLSSTACLPGEAQNIHQTRSMWRAGSLGTTLS